MTYGCLHCSFTRVNRSDNRGIPDSILLSSRSCITVEGIDYRVFQCHVFASPTPLLQIQGVPMSRVCFLHSFITFIRTDNRGVPDSIPVLLFSRSCITLKTLITWCSNVTCLLPPLLYCIHQNCKQRGSWQHIVLFLFVYNGRYH